MKGFLVSMVLGIAALALLQVLAPYTGVTLAVTRMSVVTAAVLGVPGVTLLVILDAVL